MLLSPSATRFVGPLSFAALSRHPVETDVLDAPARRPDRPHRHRRLGRRAGGRAGDRPLAGAMADGLAGDVVTAACLATRRRSSSRPAMDGDMWTHPATVANVARLRDGFGYTVVEPEVGPLASGQSGVGPAGGAAARSSMRWSRRSPVGRSGSRTPASPTRRSRGPPREADLAGRRIVVTAGGTREADRSRALHRQPLDRQDGRRDRGGRARARRAA